MPMLVSSMRKWIELSLPGAASRDHRLKKNDEAALEPQWVLALAISARTIRSDRVENASNGNAFVGANDKLQASVSRSRRN
jgi:hypothetical protein